MPAQRPVAARTARRGARALAVALALALLLLTAAAARAEAGCGSPRHASADGAHEPGARGGLFIGDSTGILAAPHLGRLRIEADARGCRQFREGLSIVRARRRSGRLPHLVVMALGANGGTSSATIGELLAAVGRGRVLALVTPRNQTDAQATMRRAARRSPGRVLLLDWSRYSRSHGGGWFAGDGLHVTDTGAKAYARFISSRARGVTSPPSRSLRFPVGGRRAKRCGTIRRGAQRLEVEVVRGRSRVTCTRAVRLARNPPLRATPNWTWWDWRPVRRARLVDVFLRDDHRAVVVTRRRAG